MLALLTIRKLWLLLLFSSSSLFLQCPGSSYCTTPFGATGVQMSIIKCEPIKWLFSQYGTTLPRNERMFLRRSFLHYNGTLSTVCCDNSMNASTVFKSVGAEILKHQAEMCGDNTVKRISLGDETTFMSYPWSALLIYDTPQQFHCGGTLITNRYVLTAAHCVAESYFLLVAVRLREHNITSEKDCILDAGGFEHCYLPVLDLKIEKVIMHPSYSATTKKHDIALLRLERDIKYERSVRPICLPDYQDETFDSEYGIITGWGATSKTKYSDVLLEAYIPLHSSENCQYNEFELCAGGKNESNPCLGDSGGPLILRIEGYMNKRKFRYLQAGIISRGNENCNQQNNAPILFTKVSAYIDWIAANIEL